MTKLQTLTHDEFRETVTSKYTDVIGSKLDGQVLSFSDEWFAAADNLIQPKAPVRDATRFTYAGAWYDGWETRRHNTEPFDWVILKMGVASAKIVACEVDTAFFNGNHAPHISVDAISLPHGEVPTIDSDWTEVIGKYECGPSQRHFIVRDTLTTDSYTHVMLKMYPDGGIARFRLYGEVIPVFNQTTVASEDETIYDLASAQNGGVGVSVSDQHFGAAENLLLPGRGHDMSDGWETKRSREPGHVDWVIIKLGARSRFVDRIVVDTAHFRGNFPQSIKIDTLDTENPVPTHNDGWSEIVAQTKTGPDKEHIYKLNKEIFATHLKLTIIPDGGVKRVRFYGKRA